MLFNFLYGHGLFFTGMVVVGICVVISLLGQSVVNRWVPLPHRKSHNDVVSYAAATGGLIYVVLLAFIASTVWISYDRADSLVNQEASLAGDLFRDALVMPPAFQQEALVALHDYVQEVVVEEWPGMSRGEPSGQKGWQYLRGFYTALGRVTPDTPVQNAVVSEMLTRLNELYDSRRERLRIASRPSLHPVIWAVVLLGGFITIAFSWLFGFEKKGLHKTSASMVAATLGLVIFLIVVFNYPFRGQVQISSAPFNQTMKYMEGRLKALLPTG